MAKSKNTAAAYAAFERELAEARAYQAAIDLCGANAALVTRYDGEWLHLVAAEVTAAYGDIDAIRAVREGRTVHFANILDEAGIAPVFAAAPSCTARAACWRCRSCVTAACSVQWACTVCA